MRPDDRSIPDDQAGRVRSPAESDDTPAPVPPPPERIGPYRVEGEIGRGGMGVVYLARDTRLDRPVALKVLSRDLADDRRQLARFEREAKALAALSHPNVATIHDVLHHEEVPALVLEFLDGETLESLLSKGPLPLVQCLKIGAQVAAALEAAHARGIVHRDLKPANVKITSSGVVKVLDFGLARAVTQDTTDGVTVANMLLGTPGYMSPEQARCEEIDARSDAWSLGCVLYECLTGTTAFEGKSWTERVAAILHEEPDWAAVPPEVPSIITAVLRRCLEKDPASRLSDLGEMRRALETGLQAGFSPEEVTTVAVALRRPEPVVKTVLVAELVDRERVRTAAGVERAREVLERHDRMAADLAPHFHGSIVESGPELLVLFERPLDAVGYALEFHAATAELGEEVEAPLAARAGLHLGEVIVQSNRPEDVERGASPIEVRGLARPTASRLLRAASAGQTLLTQGAFELSRRAATRETGLPPGLRWIGHGRYVLRGADEPVGVFEVGVAGSAPLVAPPDSDDARRHRPGNLPEQLTSFVGRDRELADLADLLGEARLVTLTGAGGCGKTRLGLAVASQVQADFAHGSWFVGLAALTEPGLLAQSVATALGLEEEPGRTVAETLREYLADRELLLVIDNCEHVGSASAELVETLLKTCTRLKILATSREALSVAGEVAYAVPTLSVPDPENPGSLQELARLESVRLFVERAAAARRGFQLDEKTAPLVAQVCHRLDGMPLAIELAAARVRMLSLEQVARRLDDCFRILTSGSRSVLPRHQTLRATIDWSHDLLTEKERILFRRLAIFAGGWTLEAAERACADEILDEIEILDLLSALVDKSLVQVEEQDIGPRYRLLQVVRQYARARLEEHHEVGPLSKRHRDHYLELVEESEPELHGPNQAEWLARLDAERENVRAALHCCQEEEGGAEKGLRLVAASWRFWQVRGHWRLGRERLMVALMRAGEDVPEDLRARALAGAGALAFGQGDVSAARALFEESLELRRELGDQAGIAVCLDHLGEVARSRGDLAEARSLYEEALELRRDLADQGGIAASLNNLGTISFAQGELAAARALYEEALALRRGLGDKRAIAASLNNLGAVASAQGDVVAARSLYEDSLRLRQELGDHAGIAASLASLAEVAGTAGDLGLARSLGEQSLALRRELGDKRGVTESLTRLGVIAKSQGDASFARSLHEEALLLKRELRDKGGIASSLLRLGGVAQDLGDLPVARQLFAEALTLFKQVGDKAGVSEALECLGWVAAARGMADRAIRLLGAAEALREALGSAVVPEHGVDLALAFAAARKALGATASEAARNAGRALTLEEATELALADA